VSTNEPSASDNCERSLSLRRESHGFVVTGRVTASASGRAGCCGLACYVYSVMLDWLGWGSSIRRGSRRLVMTRLL